MSGFFDVALRQRACRHFSDEPVPDDDVELVLRAASHAPSAENLQPWVFVVVRDAAARARIGGLAARLWRGAARGYAAPHLDEQLLEEIDTSLDNNFGGAPVIVVVGADETSGTHPHALEASIWPAVQNLLLGAAALGYGAALTTLTTLAADELRAIVELPEHIRPMAVVPVGRPARRLGPPRREPISTRTHRERYGTPW